MGHEKIGTEGLNNVFGHSSLVVRQKQSQKTGSAGAPLLTND